MLAQSRLTLDSPFLFGAAAVRGLAEELVLNPNTVARSYAELAREGIIESRGTRGMFVAPRRQPEQESRVLLRSPAERPGRHSKGAAAGTSRR